MRTHLTEWLQDLKRQSKADLTLYGYQKHVTLFINWCEDRDILSITTVSKSILDNYARYLTKAPLGNKGESLADDFPTIPVDPCALVFQVVIRPKAVGV